MSLRYWEIKDLKLAFDNQDAAYMQRYETAFDLMQKEAKELPKEGKASDRIIAYCQVFKNLFNRIFEEGTADKIFAGEPLSIDRYDEIYDNFIEFVKAGNLEAIQLRAERLAKYRPANRQQKRAAAGKKR